MAQIIQYLYEYENGKPIRNLGFVKIDKQMDKMVLQIQGKQLDDVEGIQFQTGDGRKYIATWQPNEVEIPQRPAVMPQEPPQRPAAPSLQQLPQPPIQEEEEVSAYIPPNTIRYEKIQRQDLSRLPRREWRIANNSFLLHGFYNYHHLLYIEEGEQVWIGVPGIYHEKEKRQQMLLDFLSFAG